MTVVPAAPTFEHHREPLGVGEPAPRISWVTTAPAGWEPAAYELQVSRGAGTTTTGQIVSSDSVLVPWPGAPLASRESATVRVRVWGDAGGDPSEWSEPATVEAGLLDPGDWVASAVGPAWPEEPGTDRRPPLLRRELRVDRPVVSARLYATAHGLYRLEVNGRRVGDDELAPGWTVYGTRLRYRTYDVTNLLVPGENVVGAWLGDGWYRGRIGFDGGYRDLYGTDLALIAQLHLVHDDGSETVVATDDVWTAAYGPILFSGLYEGERYDARQEPRGWSTPGFNDDGWTPVRVTPIDPEVLVAPQGPPVRCTQELSPVQALTTPSGRAVLDFGQNLAGRLRIRTTGPAGTTITLTHAEVLQDGELYTRPLREAESRDTYTLTGDPDGEVWEPRFTVHGFRYAQVDGWPGELGTGDVTARVLHTDLAPTGTFTCSDPLVDRLHQNAVWSMRSNFVDLPTDCPQRDERLGWTGDIQVFAPTAAFLYDVTGMLASWLRDLAAEQLPDGTVPWYVPVIPGGRMWTPIRPGAAWGDAAVLVPWTLYERSGDAAVLAVQLESARAWVDLVARLAGPTRLWDTGVQLGDWLDPAAPPEDPAAARTDRYLVATAYFAWSARKLGDTAQVLGRQHDADRYHALADEVRAAFLRAYALPDGRLTSDAETAYALAICFDLLPDVDARRAAGDRLAELVREAGGRIATGFVGTPLICDALTSTGHLDEAYLLLMQRECPSWLYTVLSGGTTIWERWDSLQPDGTVNPGGMTSFNHYALGAVADWLHRVVAGLAPEAPGYRRILFRPQPGGGLTSAGARHETPYGTAAVERRRDEHRLHVTVTVPTGARGRVELPDGQVTQVRSGTHTFAAELVEPAGDLGDSADLRVG